MPSTIAAIKTSDAMAARAFNPARSSMCDPPFNWVSLSCSLSASKTRRRGRSPNTQTAQPWTLGEKDCGCQINSVVHSNKTQVLKIVRLMLKYY